MADIACTTANYNICIERFRCCISPEQLWVMIAYMLAEGITRGEPNAQDILAQYHTIPLMRDPREFYSAITCLIANWVDDERDALDIWKAAQEAGFAKLSPTDRNRIILAGLCLAINPLV